MSKENPTGYDASTEYLREIGKLGPRNTPAHKMAQLRGAALNTLIGESSARAAGQPGFDAEIANWNVNSKEKRMEMVAEMNSSDKLRAAMIMEEDCDVLDFMVAKKRALDELGGQ